MDKFLTLSHEKQHTIIDAAMNVFGTAGYKKAFVSEIATAAGISKAMVFFYFGSKKALYLYLTEVAFAEMSAIFLKESDKSVTDFFERVLLGTKIKLTFLTKHPAFMKFVTTMYFETDPEVIIEVNALLKKGEKFRSDFVLTHIDRRKFKDTVNLELVTKLLGHYVEGYVSNMPQNADYDFELLVKEFTDTLDMLKINLYKEEYL